MWPCCAWRPRWVAMDFGEACCQVRQGPKESAPRVLIPCAMGSGWRCWRQDDTLLCPVLLIFDDKNEVTPQILGIKWRCSTTPMMIGLGMPLTFLLLKDSPVVPREQKTTIGGIGVEYAQFILGGLLIKRIISTSNSNVFELRWFKS